MSRVTEEMVDLNDVYFWNDDCKQSFLNELGKGTLIDDMCAEDYFSSEESYLTCYRNNQQYTNKDEKILNC